MEITMFQMGFGESILLRKENDCLLVDCGSESSCREAYFDNVVRELKKHKQCSLMISHFHADHMNGIETLNKYFLEGFEKVYVPNIFSSGDKALDLLITQYLLERIKNKRYKMYHIWDALLALVKAKLFIEPIKRHDQISIDNINFQVLLPDQKDMQIDELWNDVLKELRQLGLAENTVYLANATRVIIHDLMESNPKDEDYFKAEKRLDEIIVEFEDAVNNHIETIDKTIGINRFKREIAKLYKRISDINETSIVFHTIDDIYPQILMTGDTSPSRLKKVALKPHYDIFKSPHHGTSTHHRKFPFSYDRLLISNGETSGGKRGAICEKYLSNNGVKHVYCTNTIRNRCEYLKKYKKCASVCVNCKAGGLQINCSTAESSKTDSIKGVLKNS